MTLFLTPWSSVSPTFESLAVKPGIGQPEFGPIMGNIAPEAQRDLASGMVSDAVVTRATLVGHGRIMNIPDACIEPIVLIDSTPDLSGTNEVIIRPVR